MSVEYMASAREPQREHKSNYDVIVIGAGLGGLLSAAQFLRQGRRVLVLERLSHPGGRFTAKTFKGAQVSTGAVHMLPFGTNGELANMLRALAIPHRIHDSEVFGSFHVRGRQYVTRSMLQLAQIFGPRQFAQTLQLAAAMLLRQPRPDERDLTYREWLDRRITRKSSPELYAFFERICHFSVSVDLDDITYAEVIETMKNMFRYGPPGIVDGGCAALTGELERRVLAAGGEIWLEQDALEVLNDRATVTGVRVRNRKSGAEHDLCAPMVISNIGPEATARLTGADTPAEPESAGLATHPRREASGLKVHLLSDDSIIPHKGIMYCLDTQRIAGIVQPSNSDRRLAPPSKHLLITHQLMRSDDVNAEREAARADLRYLFGDAFGTHVEILTMSQYRGEWPVNRARQGEDVIPQTGLSGLYLVGDAVKPSGYIMVEGVAQSVNALLDTLDTPVATDAPELVAAGQPAPTSKRHTPPKPSRHRAFYWLLAPPPPHPGS
jgi:phytoene dehydrogenase-like protein